MKKSILIQILKRLKELDEGGLKLEKHLVQLEIISDLRNLQPLLTKIMDTMPITYDIRKDVRFKQGNQEGKQEGKQEVVISLLQNTSYSLDSMANLVKVSIDFVQKTKEGYEKALIMLKDENNTAQQIAAETGLMLQVVEDLKNESK